MPFVAGATKASTDGSTATTSGVDTTGATLLVAALSFYNGSATISDSYGNAWTPLTKYQIASTFDSSTQMFYVANPVVGAGHTVTVGGVFPTVRFSAFSGVRLVTPLLTQNGATAHFAAAAFLNTPTVTPSIAGVLAVSSCGSSAAATSPTLDPAQTDYADWTITTVDGVPSTNEELGFAWKETTALTGLYCTWTHFAVVSPTRTVAIALFALVDNSPPVTYEDPCSITEPRVYTVITTDDSPAETLKYGIGPLRDAAALGGYAEPRLLEVSAISRVASDPATGAWSSQTATTRFADTDRVNRARTEDRPGFRGLTQEIYLTSNAHRLANGAPRVVFSGLVHADTCEDGLVWTTEINDVIGNLYSLFLEEKQIPQRTIGVAHFPNALKDALGRAEPIVVGRCAPLNTANGEGILDAIMAGVVSLNGTRNTPGSGDVSALVADMQAAADAGELSAQFGSRLGYGDCSAYEHGTIPTTESGLKAVFGSGDIDAILSDYAVTGSTDFLVCIVACHAISEILTGANSDPSVWINDTQLDPAELGVSWWCPQIPGDTTWASTFGADRFTDIEGSDGETRRYTLICFDPNSPYGQEVLAGGRVHLDCNGLEDVGDGTGALIADYFLQYRHLLVNFLLQNYLTGSWLPTPQFLFADGSTWVDRVDSASFETASAVGKLDLATGYVGGYKLGDRASIRTVVQSLNHCGGCLLGQDDYGRLFVKLLDYRRTHFIDGHRTLRDKVDFLPGFSVESKPDWQANRVAYVYGRNYANGSYERGEGGGVAPLEDTAYQARDGGVIQKTLTFDLLRDDNTALVVASRYLNLFKALPRIVRYSRRGLCGLEDDILDGVPITHYNGYGANGWANHAVWILSKTFDPTRLYCSFTALDVERLMT